MKKNDLHEPVMVREVLEAFSFAHLKKNKPEKKERLFIDATLGTGGHSQKIIEKGGKVLGIEADVKMIEIARKQLEKACPILNRTVQDCFQIAHGNFRNIDQLASQFGFKRVSGILFDLGLSNLQLTSPIRGFSFANDDADLDMRLDPNSQGLKASDLLNALRQDQLVDLFSQVLDRGVALRIAKKVVESREIKAFEKTSDFMKIASSLERKKNLHPGTRALLALRIAVNSEFENLKSALSKSFSLLKKSGRLVVISFHSSEDQIVKNFFKSKDQNGALVVTHKPIYASEIEIKRNPKARSARMRVLEKI